LADGITPKAPGLPNSIQVLSIHSSNFIQWVSVQMQTAILEYIKLYSAFKSNFFESTKAQINE